MSGLGREITIAGAGVAGLTAAINLARAGRAVIVREARSDVGMRFHGDLEGLENWTFREDVFALLRGAGIEPDFYHRPFFHTMLLDPESRAYPMHSRTAGYVVVRRGPMAGTLDRALKQQALAAGARIEFNSRVIPAQAGGIDIIATGPRKSRAIAVGYTFRTDAQDDIVAIFDDRLAPKGYAYLVIAGGWGVASSMLYEDFAHAKEYRRRTMTRFRRIKAFHVEDVRVFGGRGIPRTRPPRDRIYVGEAAGFQDHLWGFGMRYAIESGLLAARAILEHPDRPVAAYWRLAGRRVIPMVRQSMLLREVFGRLGQGGYAALCRVFGCSRDPVALLRAVYRPKFLGLLASPFVRALAALRDHQSGTSDRSVPRKHSEHRDCK